MKVLVLGVSILLSIALLELAVRYLSAAGAIDIHIPENSAGRTFWNGDHPVVGVWHWPNASYEHQMACFRVTYESNSAGARDRERALRASQSRIIVLGDSLIEGWGLPSHDRVTDLLEGSTGIEHLNFGMSHFGPYQEYLLYRSLAKQYDHDAVMLGVFPLNDFADSDLDGSLAIPSYVYRYRPYLVPENEGYRHIDYRESALHGFLRRNSTLFHAFPTFRSAIGQLLASETDREPKPELAPSKYYDYDDEDSRRLLYILSLLQREVAGKTLIVLLLPEPRDLQRYEQQGPAPLSRELESFAREQGIILIDLLPHLHATRQGSRLFHSCDFHWSAHGSRAVAQHLQARLAGTLYPPAAVPSQEP
ncbi:MAG: hypothetical protein VX246_12910 [Myxococcota bacterium]|nr:hypothetical protein [Myxococcota bacterium]